MSSDGVICQYVMCTFLTCQIWIEYCKLISSELVCPLYHAVKTLSVVSIKNKVFSCSCNHVKSRWLLLQPCALNHHVLDEHTFGNQPLSLEVGSLEAFRKILGWFYCPTRKPWRVTYGNPKTGVFSDHNVSKGPREGTEMNENRMVSTHTKGWLSLDEWWIWWLVEQGPRIASLSAAEKRAGIIENHSFWFWRSVQLWHWEESSAAEWQRSPCGGITLQ